LFNHLKEFNKIVVVGPGRSGTRILSKIIAEETGHLYVDEGWFSSSDEVRFWKIFTSSKKMVVQAPNMLFIAHQLGQREDWAIILSRRDVKDIESSMKNLVNLGVNLVYFKNWYYQSLNKYWKTEGSLPELVYDFWDKKQKFEIKNVFEVKFDDLKNHKLFISKEDRCKNFVHSEQTTLYEESNDGHFFQNDDRVKFRWAPDYTGEKVRI